MNIDVELLFQIDKLRGRESVHRLVDYVLQEFESKVELPYTIKVDENGEIETVKNVKE